MMMMMEVNYEKLIIDPTMIMIDFNKSKNEKKNKNEMESIQTRQEKIFFFGSIFDWKLFVRMRIRRKRRKKP